MLPDYRDPKPTPTINERNDEFVKAAMSELESCLVDTADWCVKRARLASAIEIAQPDAQSSANGDAKDRIAWRLEKLNGLKSKIDEREKQYDTAREAHSAHARCRMDAYASMLTRIHPYRERLGDRLHQLVITEHERARRRLNELEQQVRRAATGAK